MSHFWEILKALGPWGVLIVSIVESLGIPNPGGTDWLLVGMAIARPDDAALCAAMAVIGSLIGTAAFFDVMRRGGERLLFDCAEGTQRQLQRSTVGLVDLE